MNDSLASLQSSKRARAERYAKPLTGTCVECGEPWRSASPRKKYCDPVCAELASRRARADQARRKAQGA